MSNIINVHLNKKKTLNYVKASIDK